MVLLMFFRAVYFGHFLSFYTMQLEPPKRVQENTELLSFCGLTGTPQRVSLLGLGGKGCSCCVHSVNVEDVGLRLPLLAEL